MPPIVDRRYIDFTYGAIDPGRIILHADPVTSELHFAPIQEILDLIGSMTQDFAISSLTAANKNNSIYNSNYGQSWNWNTLDNTSTGLQLTGSIGSIVDPSVMTKLTEFIVSGTEVSLNATSAIYIKNNVSGATVLHYGIYLDVDTMFGVGLQINAFTDAYCGLQITAHGNANSFNASAENAIAGAFYSAYQPSIIGSSQSNVGGIFSTYGMATPSSKFPAIRLIGYSSTGTSAGYGTGIAFQLTSSTPSGIDAGGVYWVLKDPVEATAKSGVEFWTVNSGGLIKTLSFDATGVFSLDLGLQNFVDDAAAATGGISINQLYRNGSVVMIRVV